jgi:hypothetical protein
MSAELLKEIKMLETLNELNLKALHEIADQRDKYYNEVQTWKSMYNGLIDVKEALEKKIESLT